MAAPALVSAIGLTVTALAASPSIEAAREYRDGAPAGFSGGFGEDSCRACHFEAELNEAPGSVTLAGVPPGYEPEVVYPVTITLTRPGMVVGGFQMTARFEDGTQAGVWVVEPGDETGVAVTAKADTRVEYAHQNAAGARLVAEGAARWTVRWTAPRRGAPAVLFHVAANAADGDESAAGDFVYTTAAASLPGR